jgi:hypothetical protein
MDTPKKAADGTASFFGASAVTGDSEPGGLPRPRLTGMPASASALARRLCSSSRSKPMARRSRSRHMSFERWVSHGDLTALTVCSLVSRARSQKVCASDSRSGL